MTILKTAARETKKERTLSTRVLFFQIDSYFFYSNFKILNRVFFLFVNIYFANLDPCCLLQFDVLYKFRLKYYVFNMFLLSV